MISFNQSLKQPLTNSVVLTLVVALLLSLAVRAPQSKGTTLLSDDFEDGSRFKTGSTDGDWLEYNCCNGGSGYLSVVPDATAGLGSGQALAAGTVDNAAVAKFPDVTLANGDTISLSFDFRVVDGFSYPYGFRFSLFNSNSSQTDGGSESNDGVGYGALFGTHTSSSVFAGLAGSTAFTWDTSSISITPVDVADALEHNIDVVLTRSGADMNAVVTLDLVEIGNGTIPANGPVISAATFDFNSLGLYNADAWSSPAATVYFDNVLVETSVVPEPTSSALMSVGLASLLVALRSRRV